MAVNMPALGAVMAGGLLMYAGIKGKSIPSAIQSVLTGQSPANASTANTIQGTSASALAGATGGSSGGGSAAPGNTGAANAGAATNQGIARLLAPQWATGQEWADWVSLWNQESGWSNTARNGGSGAYGIAQALGHGTSGTAGSVTNEYGGYGVSDATCRAANSGSASAQIQWGIAYIKQTYGDPIKAWAHEESIGWY